MSKLIYLDNSATSYPKPEAVYDFMNTFYRTKGVSPGRSGFDAALDEEQQMKEGKYKKAEKYYDSIFEGIETESLPMPDLN